MSKVPFLVEEEVDYICELIGLSTPFTSTRFLPGGRTVKDVLAAILTRIHDHGREDSAPIPMTLWCPLCKARHIDIGEFATKPHHTHSCQGCGLTWRPAVVHTVGVEYLPGFKNEPSPAAVDTCVTCGAQAGDHHTGCPGGGQS